MQLSRTVQIIDDDEAMRDSLRFLLISSGFSVRDHSSPVAFLDSLGELDLGCVVTDLRMPEVSGLDLLKTLREREPEVPVIVITGHGDIAVAVEAMKLGAMDFFEKPFSDEALCAAVARALDRKQGQDRSDAERSEISDRIERLSPRERDVLIGLVAGKQNKTIAYDLSISPRTVEVYRANLMTKMQASGLSHLVRMALIVGLSGSTADKAGGD
jgi:two-component system response regulator FixJ